MLKIVWCFALVFLGASFPKETMAIGHSVVDAVVAVGRAAFTAILA